MRLPLLVVLALEFSPAAFEWLGLRTAREWALRLTLGLTVLGSCLSTLHQSSLGALFLMMPHRVHPLWYSGFIPVFFFVSAVAAGLSMVIVESALAHRAFPSRVHPAEAARHDALTLGLAKGAALVLFAYFFLKLQGLVNSGRFDLLATPLRLLVPGRDARVRRRPLPPLRRGGSPAPRGARPLGGGMDGGRHRGEPAQRLGHRLQLEHPAPLRPRRDRDPRLGHDRDDRAVHVPLDRQPAPGAPRAPGLPAAPLGVGPEPMGHDLLTLYWLKAVEYVCALAYLPLFVLFWKFLDPRFPGGRRA